MSEEWIVDVWLIGSSLKLSMFFQYDTEDFHLSSSFIPIVFNPFQLTFNLKHRTLDPFYHLRSKLPRLQMEIDTLPSSRPNLEILHPKES